jgi:hypothetical protein
VQPQQLELSSSGRPAPILLPIPTSAGNPSGAALSLLWSRQDQLPTPAGSIANDGRSGSWIATGDYLAQLVPEGAADFRILRFRASSITDHDSQHLVPELEQVVSTTVLADAKTRAATWFDMDPRTGRIAILEKRITQASDASPSVLAFLNVFSLGTDGYHLSFAEPGIVDQPIGVAVAKDLTLLATARNLTIFSATGQTLASRDVDGDAGQAPAFDRLLGFDGRIAYLAAGLHVKVLRTSDLSELGSYATTEVVTSMATVGRYLVFGMPDALSVASSTCSILGAEK